MMTIAAIIAAAAVGSLQGAAAEAPIRLIAEPAGEGVRISVVGASAREFEGTYTLETRSAQARGNRSVNRSGAHLRPGREVTLQTIVLGNAVPGEWQARLRVDPKDGEPYEQLLPAG